VLLLLSCAWCDVGHLVPTLLNADDDDDDNDEYDDDGNYNKSPAVARVSRPYLWCTLATCVHNCPSMMFRTCCCMRPKFKRSYLLIYITSDTS